MSTITTPNIAQFGRAWKLTINTVPDESGVQQQVTVMSNSFSPEPLHITFEVFQSTQVGDGGLWYADITVYNLDGPTTELEITQGMTVSLEAGYMYQPYGTIFQGEIFQPMWEREQVTDFVLKLHCVVGFLDTTNNFSAMSFASGVSQRDIIARMAAGASGQDYPAPVNTPMGLQTNAGADSALHQTKLSRGGVLFGTAQKYMAQAAKYNNLNTWRDNIQQNIADLLQEQKNVPTVVIGAGNGLLGTPQQTQFGMSCRTLLDPRIIPAGQVFLDQSKLNVRQMPQSLNGSQYPSILSQSGKYGILSVRHVGDSRGNTWESQLTCSLYSNDLLTALQPWG